MSNIFQNRLSTSLSPAQVTAAKTDLTNIGNSLTMLIGLTVEERQSIPKIAENNLNFVLDCKTLMANNPTLVPAYMNTAELVKDITLFQQLDELESLTSQLYEKIRDTHMLAGSEAYITCLAFYRMVEAAAMAGVPGADAVYDQLKVRFANQGGAAPAPPTE